MAKPSPPTLKPKTTSFLICFRYSKNKTLRSHDDDDDKKKLKISKKSTSTTRSSSWLCCSAAARFRLKKAAATKTVPLDMISTVSVAQPNNQYRSLVDEPEPETKSKQPVKFQVPAVTDIVEDPGVPIQRRLIVSDVITPAANSKRKPPETAVSDTINLENRMARQQQQQLGSDKACQKRRLSFCRKVDSIRTSAAANGSQPGSPVQQPRTVIGAAPPPKRTRRGGGGGATVGATSSLARRKTWLVSNERMNMMTSSSKRLDPLVGMTIIMVTLIIMVLWGRLCAILCTAAWLYLLPRLSQINGNNNNNYLTTTSTVIAPSTAGNIFPHPRDDYYDLDLMMMSSDEYKKKVVLEGFLERNNHRTAGG